VSFFLAVETLVLVHYKLVLLREMLHGRLRLVLALVLGGRLALLLHRALSLVL
jgi:hypothetical protein